ncbi:MAG TPA: hypothetical protein VGR26_13605, partial [Acidimicrobiales bacterium]|nr:hypothetical protein [Acidimicrobiales bacterium]
MAITQPSDRFRSALQVVSSVVAPTTLPTALPSTSVEPVPSHRRCKSGEGVGSFKSYQLTKETYT